MAALTDANVAGILARHDIEVDTAEVAVHALAGGVSSTVLLVEAARRRYVLKQPKERFATADEWAVPTRRAKVEADLGRFLYARLGKAIVPILAYDTVDDVIIMEAAPRGWRTWKEHLLAGDVRVGAARAAGRLLAGIHALGHDLDDPDRFREDDLFDAQRIDPYFVTAGERVPEAKDALDKLSKSFFTRFDLVHGDFSPKNLFVDPAQEVVRLIDHEVATRGDAAFDLGFCLTHLVMKGLHMPPCRDLLHGSALALLDAYQNARPDDITDGLYDREARSVRWLGACLLGRAAGKSRPEYLDEVTRARVQTLGLSLTLDPPSRLHEALAAARDVGP